MKKGADFLNEFNTINFFVDQTKESVCIEFLFINGSNFGPLFKSGKVQFSLSDFLFLQRLLILSPFFPWRALKERFGDDMMDKMLFLSFFEGRAAGINYPSCTWFINEFLEIDQSISRNSEEFNTKTRDERVKQILAFKL